MRVRLSIEQTHLAAGLQPLLLEHVAKNLLLQADIVARIERGITDDDGQAAVQRIGSAAGQPQGLNALRQTLHAQNRGVPMRVDERRFLHLNKYGRRGDHFLFQVETRAEALDEADVFRAQPAGE